METKSFRCDKKLKDELLFIQNLHDTNQSQAIKEAIHAYYLILKEEQMSKKSPGKIFRRSGYLGGFKGDKDLSTSYKEVITKGIKRKYDKK
jgi:hypothetical protein